MGSEGRRVGVKKGGGTEQGGRAGVRREGEREVGCEGGQKEGEEREEGLIHDACAYVFVTQDWWNPRHRHKVTHLHH